MDVPAISMAMSQGNVLSQFKIEMLDKSLELREDFGEQIVNALDRSSMELSVNPAVGSNFDMSV